jgi:predicted DNA-binding protein YlxM (UPF0122 family)
MEITTYSEFGNMPLPDPPPMVPDWKEIYREGPAPRVPDPDRITMYDQKRDFNMTVKEIAEYFNVTNSTINRVINSGLDKLRETFEEQAGTTDRSKLMQSMLFLEEDTNFFNPNQGGKGDTIWHQLRSLSEM